MNGYKLLLLSVLLLVLFGSVSTVRAAETWWGDLADFFGWPVENSQPAAVTVTNSGKAVTAVSPVKPVTDTTNPNTVKTQTVTKTPAPVTVPGPKAVALPTKAQLDQSVKNIPQAVVNKPSPVSPAGGCASVPLPAGLYAQTVRCDGNQWVADYNLMNNGQTVGVGAIDNSGHNKLLVSQNNIENGTAVSAWSNGNYATGVVGVGGSNGVGVLGYNGDNVGVLGTSEGGTGLRGNSNTGPGTLSYSTRGDGIQGFTSNQFSAAVRAQNYDPNGFAFYQDSPTNVNYFGGRVGIGLTNPTAGFKLEVQGHGKVNGNFEVSGAVAATQFCLQSPDGQTDSCIGQWPTVGSSGGTPGDNTSVVTATGLNINYGDNNQYDTHFNYQNNGTNYIRGKTIFAELGGGNVGIGTANPTAKLEVNGALKLSPTAVRPVCTEQARGSLWFVAGANGEDDHLYLCARHSGNLEWLGN